MTAEWTLSRGQRPDRSVLGLYELSVSDDGRVAGGVKLAEGAASNRSAGDRATATAEVAKAAKEAVRTLQRVQPMQNASDLCQAIRITVYSDLDYQTELLSNGDSGHTSARLAELALRRLDAG